MSAARAWLRAARLPSQSYIALPLVFGQVAAWSATGRWSWAVFALVHAFGLFDQLFIVLANDYADETSDAANDTATIFSGGSRVLARGELRPHQLRRAAWAMATACLGTAVATAVIVGQPALVALAAAALVLLWMYSFAPLRLNYRGGGELLQAAGVGVVLPVYGYLAQAGEIDGFPWPLLAALIPAQLGCAIATSLPDAPSDAATGKHSATVMLGARGAKAMIVALEAAAIGLLVALAPAAWGRAETIAVVAPAAITAALPLVGRTPPGGFRLSVFVFLAIAATLALTVAATIAVAP